MLALCSAVISRKTHFSEGEVEQDDGKTHGNKNISGKLISKGVAPVCKQPKKISGGFPFLSQAGTEPEALSEGKQAGRQPAAFHPPR